MNKVITLAEAKAPLSALVTEAEEGREITITATDAPSPELLVRRGTSPGPLATGMAWHLRQIHLRADDRRSDPRGRLAGLNFLADACALIVFHG
jgi:antitoxin (DNA-binding transcriptional repressor) of toxin-antitoxin stability system